jgi:hypothetical protein
VLAGWWWMGGTGVGCPLPKVTPHRRPPQRWWREVWGLVVVVVGVRAVYNVNMYVCISIYINIKRLLLLLMVVVVGGSSCIERRPTCVYYIYICILYT